MNNKLFRVWVLKYNKVLLGLIVVFQIIISYKQIVLLRTISS